MKKKKIKGKLKICHLLIMLCAVLVFTSPFVHKEFAKKNIIVETYRKELRQEVKSIEKEILLARSQYGNKLITAPHYIELNELLINKKLKTEKRHKKLIKQKVNKNRFVGFKTVRKFLGGLGIRLPFCFLTLIVTFLISKIVTEDKYLKKSLFFLQIACYGLSFYFMFWVFWTSQDFSVVAYRYFFVSFSIISSIATVYFINYRELFKTKLELKLKGIIAYVLEIRNKHYPKIAMNSLEIDEEGTISRIKEFEKRTTEELNKTSL